MVTEFRLYEDGLEEYPLGEIVFGNLMMLFWIALGAVGVWFISPLSALVYAGVAVVVVFLVLRRLVCVNCYYYGRWCPIGWGKLTSLFFKEGKIEDFNSSIGLKLAPLTYGLLSLIPLVALIISIVWEASLPKIAVLLLLLLVSAYSGAIGRKKACAGCKMRTVCPGRAVKESQ